MSGRYFRHAYQVLGIRPFALPGIALLLLAVIADRYSGAYLEQLERTADQQREMEVLSARLDQRARVDAVHAVDVPLAGLFSGRMFAAPTAGAAQSALQARLQGVFSTLPIHGAEFSGAGVLPGAAVAAVQVEARFPAVPQQLVRLDQALSAADKALKIDQVVMTVRPDPAGGRELYVRARVAALYQQIEMPAAQPDASKAQGGTK